MTAATHPVVCWHPANKLGRDLVVGDVHGCVDALRYLLNEIGFDGARDRLFSVGDLVDRGSDSLAALDLLDQPWFYPVSATMKTRCARSRAGACSVMSGIPLAARGHRI